MAKKTPFRVALGICALSPDEAADILGVSLSIVQKWSTGDRTPGPEVWAALAAHWKELKIEARDPCTEYVESIALRALEKGKAP